MLSEMLFTCCLLSVPICKHSGFILLFHLIVSSTFSLHILTHFKNVHILCKLSCKIVSLFCPHWLWHNFIKDLSALTLYIFSLWLSLVLQILLLYHLLYMTFVFPFSTKRNLSKCSLIFFEFHMLFKIFPILRLPNYSLIYLKQNGILKFCFTLSYWDNWIDKKYNMQSKSTIFNDISKYWLLLTTTCNGQFSNTVDMGPTV